MGFRPSPGDAAAALDALRAGDTMSKRRPRRRDNDTDFAPDRLPHRASANRFPVPAHLIELP